MYYLFGILLFLYLAFLSAWSIALAARFSSRVMQFLSAFFTAAIQLTVGCFLLYGFWRMEYRDSEIRGFCIPYAIMLAGNVSLFLFLLVYGLWQKNGMPRAKHWPHGHILLATLSCAFLAAITYGTIDRSLKQFLHEQDTLAVKRLKEILERDIPEAENAAPIYREIGPQLDYQYVPLVYRDWLKANPSRPPSAAIFSDPQVVAYYDQIAPHLKKGREAADRPFLQGKLFLNEPGTRNFGSTPADDVLFHIRNMTRSWEFSAGVHRSRGDFSEAIKDINSLRSLSLQTSQQQTFLNQIISIATFSVANDSLMELMGSYPMQESDLVGLHESLKISPQSLALTIEVEELQAKRILVACYSNIDNMVNREPGRRVGLRRRLAEFGVSAKCVCSMKGDFARLDQIQAGNRQSASLPAWELLKYVAETAGRVKQNDMGSILSRQDYVYASLCHATVRSNTIALVSQASLAAHRYRLKHGDFPTSLDALKTFDPSLDLIDPYTGQPLHMFRQEDTLTIYSVGPNLQDDGGSDLFDSNGSMVTGDIPFRLNISTTTPASP